MGKVKSLPKRIDCGHIRRLLLQTGIPVEPAGDNHRMIEQHLSACAACRNFREEHHRWRQLGGQLQQRSDKAPIEVRRRLFRVVALARSGLQGEQSVSERKKRSLFNLSVSLCLAAVVVAAGIAWWRIGFSSWNSDKPTAVEQAIAEEHWRELHRATIESADPRIISQWLSSRVAVPIEVMQFENAQLKGARLCFLNNQQGAVIVYQVEGEAVSYFIMPTHDTPAQRAAEMAELRNHARRGYNIVAWRKDGLLHALVSSLSNQRLRQLAGSCYRHTDRVGTGQENVRPRQVPPACLSRTAPSARSSSAWV